MSSMTQNTFRISRPVLLYCSITLLLLPCILFILGWIRPIIAIPFSILLTAASINCCKNIVSNCHPAYRYSVARTKDVINLIITLILLLIFVDIIGVTGHVQQSADFSVRNAIYSELKNSPWPIYSDRGEYFTYYHSFWLPPALLAKLIPFDIADSVLFVWMYLILALSAIVLFLKIRGKVLYFFIIFLIAGNLIDNLKVTPLLAEKFSHIVPYCDHLIKVCHNLAIESHVRYLNVWTQYVYTFNHAIPLTLYFALIITGLIPKRYLLFTSALVFTSSPLGVAPMLPILIYIIWKQRNIKQTILRWENWVGALFVLSECAYLYGQSGGTSGMVFLWQHHDYWNRVNSAHGYFVHIHVRLLRYFTVAGAMLTTIWLLTTAKIRNTVWFAAFNYLIIVLPIVWIGRWNNEFLFKGSLILFMIWAWLMISQWKHSSFMRKKSVLFVIILSSLHVFSDINRRNLIEYTWEKEKIQNNKRTDWGGTLNRPDIFTYDNFWGENKFPTILNDNKKTYLIK